MEPLRLKGTGMKHNIIPLFIVLNILTMAALHIQAKEAASQMLVPGDSNKTSAMPSVPKLLRFGLDMENMKNKLDPHFASESRDRAIAEMIFNRLIRYKPGSATQLEPDLAQSIPKPEIVYGKQVRIFTLRKGIMFHPGPETEPYEMTADDVVWSLQRSANKVNPLYSGDYSGMTVEKDGDCSVRITLEKPMSPTLFNSRLATYPGGFIISRKAFETMGRKRFEMHPTGTGPFMVENFTPGGNISLKANEQYFRGRPCLDGVELLSVPDIMERESFLKTGDLDIIEGVPESRWVEKMVQEPNIVVDLQGIGEVAMLHFNMSVKPLDDIRVRRAIAYALDRNVFLKCFGGRVARNIYAPVPADILIGGLEKKKVDILKLEYATDLGKARQLLAEAGYPEGFPLEFVTSEKPVYHSYYKSIKAQLAQIGIDCKLKIVRHTVMHTLIRWNKNPIVVYIAWRPDADAILTRFFHSDSIVMKGDRPEVNFSHYDKADKLIETARLETDIERQIRLWGYAQIKILDHIAAYPIHYLNPVHARRSSVDYGHELGQLAIYPHITEKTDIRGQ